MAWWSLKNAAASVAGACVLVACFGGQTGQPESASPQRCERQVLSANQSEDGVSPAELARAFEGSHRAVLAWRDGPPGAERLSIPDDELTVALTYQGASGSACDDLQVEVAVEITTRDSGIHETGNGTLVGLQGSLSAVTLFFHGKQVDVTAQLQTSSTGVELRGALTSTAGNLPGPRADFSPAVASAGNAPEGSGGSP